MEKKLSSNVNIDDSDKENMNFPILLVIADDAESPEIISSKIIIFLKSMSFIF